MRYAFLVAFIDGTFTVMCSTLNAMNKFKLIYIIVLIGLGLNALMDVPLILLFDKINIYPYYGAITATLLGYSISIIVALTYLHRKCGFNYEATLKKLPRLLLSILILSVLCIAYENIISGIASKYITILLVFIFGLVLLILYYLLNQKTIDELIHFKTLDKIKKKLHI
jgi:O-antigen/teichoic acid export membrane protein